MLQSILKTPTAKILKNYAKFAVSQLPKVATWGLPAAMAGIVHSLSAYIIIYYLSISVYVTVVLYSIVNQKSSTTLTVKLLFIISFDYSINIYGTYIEASML